jgi:hypothetical protein
MKPTNHWIRGEVWGGIIMKCTHHWIRGEVCGGDENIIEDANLFKVSYA